MKSIIHEASSIGKAIEQGWQKAGCPKEFSVRILEEPERNFIGLTVKTAKVALFFGEKTQQPSASPAPRRRESLQQPREARATHNQPATHAHAQAARPQRQQRAQEPRPERTFERSERPERIERTHERQEQVSHESRERQSFWTDEHATFARDWVSGALSALGKHSIPFVVETKGYHLHIALSERLMNDPAQEKHLFANCAFLLGEALKRQFRTSLRGHKIVLTHGRNT